MKVLLTNDDGIHSPGLIILAEKLAKKMEVFIVAPRTEQSGISQAITFLRPMFPVKLTDEDTPAGTQGYSLDGTPTDCIKVGLAELSPWQPDLVVSGMNSGLNAGCNVCYSGTVAGALAGATMGIKSIAISTEYAANIDFETATDIGVPLIEQFAKHPLPNSTAININIPTAALKGDFETHVVPVETNPLGFHFAKGVDPKGREYVWSTNKPDPEPSPHATDCSVLLKGHVSVSPVRSDLNDQVNLATLQQSIKH
jgi:5'-nucleotidase